MYSGIVRWRLEGLQPNFTLLSMLQLTRVYAQPSQQYLLHLHMMNTTMNRQQRKTIYTDMNSMMTSLKPNNLILRPNLKPKTTSHSPKQTQPYFS